MHWLSLSLSEHLHTTYHISIFISMGFQLSQKLVVETCADVGGLCH